MGRAIVRDPQVFLFDEPLSNLDAKLRVAMRSEIKELHQRLKTTSIYVTHDQIEAMTMADQIVVMHDGIIEQIGSPLELYDHPQNKFVAGFIGSPAMNFISGTYRSGDRPMFETHTGERLMLPELTKPLTDGQAIDFGVRPEHLDFADDGLSVEVSVVEPTGSETMVLSHLGKQDLVAVFRERHAFAPGQKVNLRPRIDQCHVFDPVSGNRVSA